LKKIREETMKREEAEGITAQALKEILGRLTPEEKKEFARLVDLDELMQLKAAVSQKRRIGDPKVYVGTTPSGLSLELPVEHAIEFVRWLADVLTPQRIEIFTSANGGSREYSCSTGEFSEFLRTHQSLSENWSMIEFDEVTLVSGGGGCFSLALEGVSKKVIREIAQGALELCGFEHRFSADEFSAVVWDGELEVKE
jgi:hypothetical protein